MSAVEREGGGKLASPGEKRLGTLLLESGLLTPEQLDTWRQYIHGTMAHPQPIAPGEKA